MRIAVLAAAVIAVCPAGCSWLGWGGSALVDGARVVAVETARAGALVATTVASGTYEGSRRAVTWTGSRAAEGTAATLEALNLIERPVPRAILERIPEDLLVSLRSLEYVDAAYGGGGRAVIASPDSRWEGEVMYRVAGSGGPVFRVDGPATLIVVTISAAADDDDPVLNEYTVRITEDGSELGEVTFAAGPADGLSLYGYRGWKLSEPGVFAIEALEGRHSYGIDSGFTGEGRFMLAACFLPRYLPETTGGGR